ncbi:hypothetical protein BC939DRAFT_473718 [Gamsiella multidivaricata]|uniref:uncharacterized protein n=1 Tax=Gamsiella multidivaricata TaxID=101098 RepID=UPI002220F96F|nr:uncharacterized protein BC939DRAFT_473718 [Gamsiella multidivaricata]KAG0368699.1 hypothetical protein BGZ54_001341 [Gamsiella multidivaricata]KAI7830507.1 hypothetical protein BC939DRAFT_473718 [Gamsiella multidivaricata]
MSESITQDLCLVERILQKRTDAETGAVEYLIRWQGSDAQGKQFEDSWEPEQNVLGEELIEEFERRQAARRAQRRTSPSRTKGPGPWDGATDSRHSIRSLQPNSIMQMSTSLHPEGASMNHPDMPHGAVLEPYPPLPPPGFYAGHPYQYPPMYSHPSYPIPYPPLPPPSHRGLTVRGQPKRDRPSQDNTRYSKRRLSSGVAGDLGLLVAGSRTLEDISPEESDALEGVKQQKNGQSVRSHLDRPGEYAMRRRALSSNENAPSTIRLLKLDFDHEKAFFRSVIEKSALVKDANMRAEMIRFLKDPNNPGLPQGALLLESQTWLIEVKERPETSSSLFLALDVPKGIVKALSIPERLLEHKRLPGEGIVMKERAVVSAIMEGDLQGSGLYQSISDDPSQLLSNAPPSTATGSAETSDQDSQSTPAISSGPAAITPSDPKLQHPRANGDIAMGLEDLDRSRTDIGINSLMSCRWTDCQQTFATMRDLSMHVQQAHLQGLLPESERNVSDASTMSPTAADVDMDGPWVEPTLENSNRLAQDAYQLLRDQIASTKELTLKMDRQIRDSRALYMSAISGTKENIRRLEAHLEWEMMKWDKYRDQKGRMLARDNDFNPLQEEAESNGNQAQPNGSRAHEGSDLDLEARRMDKPIEAQSMNSIRDIQRMLVDAKDNLSRLEEDNMALFEKRRTLDAELRSLEQSYNQATAQRAVLKNSQDAALEELKVRTRNIEDCKAAMKQDQMGSQRVVGELQTMIGALMHPQPSQQREPQPIYPSHEAHEVPNGQTATLSPLTVEVAATAAPETFADPALLSTGPSVLPANAPVIKFAGSPPALSFCASATESSAGSATMPMSSESTAFQPLDSVSVHHEAQTQGTSTTSNVPTNFIELLTKNING